MSNIDLSFRELESGSIDWYPVEDFENHLKTIWGLSDYKVTKEAHTEYAPKIDWGFGLSDVFALLQR